MKYIEINNDLQAENGDIFKKSSVLNVLTKASKYNTIIEVLPIKAVDEQNLPYPITSTFSINSKKLEEVGYKELDRKTVASVEKEADGNFGFNFPGAQDEEDDGLNSVLSELYEDKDYTINTDGVVRKKAELEKEAEGTEEQRISDQDKITQKPVSDKPDGTDDPGTTDNYKEDTGEKKAPATIIGPIPAMKKKLQSIRKKLSEVENQNLSDDDKIAQDKKTDVPGSAKVTNPYKADESEMLWSDKNLGKTN